MEAYSVYTKDGNLEILLTEASTQLYVPQKAKEYHFFTDKKKLFFCFTSINGTNSVYRYQIFFRMGGHVWHILEDLI